MAAGMAIVTNPATGCGEVVGDCALQVDPEIPEDIRGALIELISNPDLSEELGHRARKRFEHHFTWRAVAAQYDSLYREIAIV
jgi:glycosyltransferase involved in cell wall biosynthesis